MKSSDVASGSTGSKEKVVIDRPSSLSMIWTIARRELDGYFNSVITYIVISASMVGLGLFFYMYKGGFWQVDRVTMQRMFDFLPFALCALVIPACSACSASPRRASRWASCTRASPTARSSRSSRRC
jgi:hypothetical protein